MVLGGSERESSWLLLLLHLLFLLMDIGRLGEERREGKDRKGWREQVFGY